MAPLTNSLTAALASAYEAYRHGRYESARSHLNGLVHPKAAHLLGMISRKQGRLVEAREHLEWAANAAKTDTQISLSLAQLYQEIGLPQLAETTYEQVLAGKSSEATKRSAQLGFARLLAASSQVERALAVLEDMPGEDSAANHIRGQAFLELGELARAREVLQHVFDAQPKDSVLRSLAQVLWLAGDRQEFEQLVGRASRLPGLGATSVEVARSSNQLDWAWQIGLGVAAAQENPPAFRTAMATLAVDRGDAQSAIALAGDVVRSSPLFGPAVAAVISAQLMLGNTDKAETLIARMRGAEPNGQHWIAYELIAMRQRDTDVSALTTALVGVYELPVPGGFDTLESFNAAFSETLKNLRGGTQQPLGQSLRGGTQTGRNLATLNDPVVKAYMKALKIPVAQHLLHIGRSHNNPCSARNTGQFAINDCWSVTLEGAGFHESHVHPEGWLSSAYYVEVPDSLDAEQHKRSGWLKFGEPPLVLPVAQEPLHWIEPRPGMLALFPSYLWHSTQPLAAQGTRVTAPFDVVPV